MLSLSFPDGSRATINPASTRCREMLVPIVSIGENTHIAVTELSSKVAAQPLLTFLTIGKLPPCEDDALLSSSIVECYKVGCGQLKIPAFAIAIETALIKAVNAGHLRVGKVMDSFKGLPRVEALFHHYAHLPGIDMPPPFDPRQDWGRLVKKHGALFGMTKMYANAYGKGGGYKIFILADMNNKEIRDFETLHDLLYKQVEYYRSYAGSDEDQGSDEEPVRSTEVGTTGSLRPIAAGRIVMLDMTEDDVEDYRDIEPQRPYTWLEKHEMEVVGIFKTSAVSGALRGKTLHMLVDMRGDLLYARNDAATKMHSDGLSAIIGYPDHMCG